MALNCIKNVLHSCRSLISGALLALPLLTGCSGDSEIPDLADTSDKLSSESGNYITLDLSVGVNNGMGPSTRTFVPGDNHPFEEPSSEYEKVHTLRVVIVRHKEQRDEDGNVTGVEYLIEHNRMVNVNEEYSNGLSGLVSSYYVINDNLQFKVIADEMKTIYLFANEKAVNLNKPTGEEFDFTNDLKVGEPFPTERMENLLITRKNNAAFIDNGATIPVAEKHYIPMSEFFNVKIPASSGKAEDFYYKTLFITRSLIKFSFSIAFNQGDLTEEEWNAIQNVGMKLSGVKITNLANSSYYLPNNTEYKPSKYPDAEYPDDIPYLEAGGPQTDNSDREIISFTVPENAGASEYTFMFDKPIKITKKGTEGNNEVSPAIYLPESKTGKEDNYMVSLIFDDESLNNQYESKPLPLTTISRNTHVKVNMVVNLKRQTMEATVTLFPYTGVNLKPLFGFSVPVKSVHITGESSEVAVGQTVSLVGYVSPEDANNKNILWASSDTIVAKVSSYGLVTGITPGTTEITATSEENDDIKAIYNITVTPKIPVTSISLEQTSWTGNIGETVNLIATVEPEDATNKNILWTSNDTTVATVSSYGTVTAVDGGSVGKEAIITAASEDDDIKAECRVWVNRRVPVTSVSIYQNNAVVSSLTLTEGGLSSLRATVTPTDATNQNIKWASNDTTVATVSSYGLVTAIKAGNATITATSEDNTDKYATCDVRVNKKTIQVSKVEVSPDKILNLVPGVTYKSVLTATVTLSNNTTNTNVTWSSANPDVATVSGRDITAVSKGETEIIATSVDDPTKFAKCKVTVINKIPVTGVSIPSTCSLTITATNPKPTFTLSHTVSPENASYKNLLWISSNPSVATVDSSGKVTGVSKGKATITATSVDNPKVFATCTVTVN